MTGDLKDMRAYARGYEDGRRSKDAEHAAVALRLSRLRFDGGSHENLSKIAYAVYPCATGWTCESAKGLRDRLIDLLGGVHEHRCDTGRDCACYDSRAGDSGELAEAMTYDVLGNERHKAVCELRNVQMNTGNAIKKLSVALGIEWNPNNAPKSVSLLQDRLIHLLGGDQPTQSDLFGIWQDGEESKNRGSESAHKMTKSAEIAKPESDDGGENCRITDENLNGESLIESLVRSTEELSRQGKVKFPPNEDWSIEGLKTVEETTALIDEVKRRADQSHKSSPMSLENETGITAELRHFMEDPLLGYATQDMHKEVLAEIADHIDEQFGHIYHQQGAVLQSAISYLTEECNKLHAECDQLRAKLEEADAAIANWRERERSFDAAQDKLDAIREALDGNH